MRNSTKNRFYQLNKIEKEETTGRPNERDYFWLIATISIALLILLNTVLDLWKYLDLYVLAFD